MAELTGQSSSIKTGEVAHTDGPRESCSEHCKGISEKVSRAPGVSSNGEFWILHVLGTIRKLESMSKNVHIAFPIDNENEAGNNSVEKTKEVLTRLKTVRRTLEDHPGHLLYSQVDNEDQCSIRGAQLLLAGTVLQQYCTAGEAVDGESDDGSEVIDVRHFASLAFVFVHAFPKKQATINAITQLFPAETSDKDKKKKKRKGVVKEEAPSFDGDKPLPIDVLTDTIIGFLEKGTAFLRIVANQSFSLLSARLERSTIELILTVGITPSCDATVLDSV